MMLGERATGDSFVRATFKPQRRAPGTGTFVCFERANPTPIYKVCALQDLLAEPRLRTGGPRV